MNLIFLKKRCEYCKEKIEKGEEILKEVKVPEFLEKKPRVFCSEEHADNYEKEMEEYINYCNACGLGGGCCGVKPGAFT